MKEREYTIGQTKFDDGRRGPAFSNEKGKNTLKTWGKLLRYCRPWRGRLLFALLAALVGTIMELAGPELLSQMSDLILSGLMTGVDLGAVGRLGMTLAGMYVLSAALQAAQGYVTAGVTQALSKRMRGDISRKINRLPMAYFHLHPVGDTLSRVTNDVDTLSRSLHTSAGTLVSSLAMLLGAILLMVLTDVRMTLAAVLSGLAGFAAMSLIMGRSQKYFADQQRDLGRVNAHIEEVYAGHTQVQAASAEEQMKGRFTLMNAALRDSGFKAQCLSGLMMPLMGFVGNLGYVAVCVTGAALAAGGHIRFGVIVAFMMYVRFFTQPLSRIAQAVQQVQAAAAAGDRVFEMLEKAEMPDESGKTQAAGEVRGEVVFDHVRFTYPGSEKPVIGDFSAVAKAGRKVAIVGPTGAGKTTLVNLLMRYYSPDGGRILIDGRDIADMTAGAVRGLFCMVLQDTWLFEGTVRENLVYATEGVSDEKMIAAARLAGLDHFIRTLPKGYDTMLGEKVSLSQGQKQQITIARAMLADKPMLILDEATSSVDTRTELAIQRAMDTLMAGRTSFVIAHRLSTVKNADLILVLKDGDVIESGNHEELLKLGGFYSALYNSQFDKTA